MSWLVAPGGTQRTQSHHPICCQEGKAPLVWTLVDAALTAVCLGLLCLSSDALVPQFLLLMRVAEALNSVSVCLAALAAAWMQLASRACFQASLFAAAAAPLQLQSEDRGLS